MSNSLIGSILDFDENRITVAELIEAVNFEIASSTKLAPVGALVELTLEETEELFDRVLSVEEEIEVILSDKLGDDVTMGTAILSNGSKVTAVFYIDIFGEGSSKFFVA